MITPTLKSDIQALDQLRRPEFQAAWKELFAACPWTAPAQSAAFVMTWYDVYQEEFTPVVVYDYRPGGILSGLLTLAASRTSSSLIVAGDPQGEYKVWLALPENNDAFIIRAFSLIRQAYPRRNLLFKYIPSKTPLRFLARDLKLRRYCLLRSYRRPLVEVSQARVAESFRKPYNRSRFNRLSRIGEVAFERVGDLPKAEAALNAMALQYDFRQGAAHNSFPFQEDPYKKSFQLALLARTELLYFTTLRVGGSVVSAHLGLHNTRSLQLGISAYSVLLSKCSPGKLHFMLLEQKLVEEGIATFDLTPGGEWKKAYANRHDEVYSLTVYGTLWGRVLAGIRLRAGSIARLCIKATGKSPDDFAAAVQGIKRLGLRGNLHRMRSAGRKLRAPELFRCELAAVSGALEHQDLVAVDNLGDLLAFQPVGPWPDRQGFLQLALTRFERGYHSYTRVEHGRLISCIWMLHPGAEPLPADLSPRWKLPESAGLITDSLEDLTGGEEGSLRACIQQVLYEAKGRFSLRSICFSTRRPTAQRERILSELGFRRKSQTIATSAV